MFAKDSQLVRNFVYLISKGLKNIEDVPDLDNLREVVADAVTN